MGLGEEHGGGILEHIFVADSLYCWLLNEHLQEECRQTCLVEGVLVLGLAVWLPI